MKIVYLIFIFILVFLFLRYKLKYYPIYWIIRRYLNPKKPNICILLTMYCTPERVFMYTDVAKQWLNTGLPIFSVDSYGTGLNKIELQNLTQTIFKQNNSSKINSSIAERDSILKVLPKLNSYDFIFKVTGKYYLPYFPETLYYIPSNTEVVLQHRTGTHGQNSEIFGIKPSLLPKLLKNINNDTSMEQALLALSKEHICYRMVPLKPYKKVKRNDGSELYYL